MKTVLIAAMLSLFAPIMRATVLVNDPGPRGGSSCGSNWISLCGYNLAAAAPATNSAEWDVGKTQHGSPFGPYSYNMKVTVLDNFSGTTYSTAFVSGTLGHKSTTINVPP